MKIDELKAEISNMKTTIHFLSINNVEILNKKEFDILRELETKMGEFLDEQNNE